MKEILPISSLIPATRTIISSVIVNGGLYAFIAISQYHQPLSFQYAPAALPICSFTLYLTGLRHMLVSSCHRATADITFLCDILIRCSWSTAYDMMAFTPFRTVSFTVSFTVSSPAFRTIGHITHMHRLSFS